MKLVFNGNRSQQWNHHIVYAPNGFGKTTNAEKIKTEFENRNQGVAFFTRRTIEDLVKEFGDKIYVGTDAKTITHSLELKKNILDNAPLKQMAAHLYGAKSMAEAKKKSFGFSTSEYTNLKDIPSFKKSKKEINDRFGLSQSDFTALESALDPTIFQQAKKLVSTTDGQVQKELENPKGKEANSKVPEEYIPCLFHLYFYSKLNHLSQCILCGHKYRGSEALIDEIEKHYKDLAPLKNETFSQQILRCAEAIEASIKLKNSTVLNRIFGEAKANTVLRSFRLVRMYYELCLQDQSTFNSFIEQEPLPNGMNVGEAAEEYSECIAKIEGAKKKPDTIKRFTNFIEREVKKLIHFPENIRIQGVDKECGFNVYVNGKIAKNPAEFLSESELKRLSLIVMKAETIYSHKKCLILDDPIDSYDDYNKLIASDYISRLLQRKSLTNWYLFTNDFDAVYLISQKSGVSTWFYLESLNPVFGMPASLIECECDKNEVQQISKNEIAALASFINDRANHFHYDGNLFLCALSLSLRNLKTEIVEKYKGLIVKDCSATPLTQNSHWTPNVDNRLEARSEHFMPTIPGATTGDSASLTVSDVAQCFYELSPSSRSFPAQLLSNSNSFETFRENVMMAPQIMTNTYVDVINYLYKKTGLVNLIKYEMEKKLIVLCQNTFTNSELVQIVNEKGFGKKLGMAKTVDKNHGNIISIKLKKFDDVYKEFDVMFNSFDHAMTLTVTPGLSTSVDDIATFKTKVNSL